jgi:hypothetical protein
MALAEPNAARSDLGATATASVDGNFTVESSGDIALNNQRNTESLAWIVLDFHKKRSINEIALTIDQAHTEDILFDLKIWGGTLFLPSSPPVQGTIAKNAAQPQQLRRRFAEQKTQKILIEFGTLDANGIFNNDRSLTLIHIEIKAFSFPSDLAFGIGDQPPFHTHPGELAPGMVVAASSSRCRLCPRYQRPGFTSKDPFLKSASCWITPTSRAAWAH